MKSVSSKKRTLEEFKANNVDNETRVLQNGLEMKKTKSQNISEKEKAI